jgi:hypothetical protein
MDLSRTGISLSGLDSRRHKIFSAHLSNHREFSSAKEDRLKPVLL